ncbi:hypothetical protein ILUMI_11420, partial [Ignelater luminosus]
VHRDAAFWEQILLKLKIFYYKCLLPEIIDPRHCRDLPIRNPPRNNSEDENASSDKLPDITTLIQRTSGYNILQDYSRS